MADKAKKEEAVAEEVAVAQPKQEVSAKEANPEKFLKDFNWHNYEEGIDQVDEGQLEEFEKLVAENFVDTLDDEVVEGEVVYLTDRDAIIDINAKSEGVISLNEFRYNPNLKVGDKVEVLIDVREDATGQLILSHRKARTIKAWDRVNKAHDEGTVVNGFVKCRTKGGMIVDVFGIEAFLPGSQIDVKPIRDYDVYVGKTMEFKIVKINHEFKNVVVSHKALIEADIEEQKKE
ncbi:MAG TPA: 30S ribosomal protein S1, partial [Flavobacteriaceae bacterium]|nr:30S ribosomal protein S1 [Flavobacteriaceae bacterium]